MRGAPTARRVMGALGATGLVAAGVVAAGPAAADEPPAYGPGATATVFAGRAFDGCVTPSPQVLEAWRLTTDYRAYEGYLSGRSRACRTQPFLTPETVRLNARRGWHLVPIHVGRQAPCSAERQRLDLDPTLARTQGRVEADEAVAAARALGLLPGSALYYDMEGYDDDAACTAAVLAGLSGWTDRLHEEGFLSGVYSSASSGVRDLGRAYDDPGLSRPDAIWVARWDGQAVLTDPEVPEDAWLVHQRMKQYRGEADESHGGETMLVDANVADVVLGSVPVRHQVSGSGAVPVHTGPTARSRKPTALLPGSLVDVACTLPEEPVLGSPTWAQLTTGGWVRTDRLATPAGEEPAGVLPRCSRAYQVVVAANVRSAPTLTAPAVGALLPGSLAFVECQVVGDPVGGSRVWDRLSDGTWVADSLVRTPSERGFSPHVPRCPA